MAKNTIIFNGVDLSTIIRARWEIDEQILPNMSDDTINVGGIGEKFIQRQIGIRKITVPFDIIGATQSKREKLTEILNVSEPKPLVFTDRPNTYYMAMPLGEIEFGKVALNDESEMTFVAYDPLRYSKDLKTADNSVEPTQIDFENEGGMPADVKLTATMKGDNGFLGFALGDRVYQIGNPSEVNGYSYDKSEYLTDGTNMPPFSTGVINKPGFVVIPPDQGAMKQQGSLFVDDGGTILAKDYGPAPAQDGPRGPSITYELPADSFGDKGSKNFVFRWHAGFGNRAGEYRNVGQLCATLHTADGKAVCSMLYQDLSQTSLEFNVRYDLNNKMYYEQRVKEMPGGFTGHAYIIKSGATFTFCWGWMKPMTFICEELKDTKVTHVSFSYLKWMDVPTVSFFGLINWNFQKNFTDLYNDVPNYFSDGDVVVLDSAKNQLTINDFKDWDRVDIGSKNMLAPPGKNTLRLVWSDWAQAPDVKIEYRERWL